MGFAKRNRGVLCFALKNRLEADALGEKARLPASHHNGI